MTATMLSPPATWTPKPRTVVEVDVRWLEQLVHDHGPPWRDPTGEQAVRNVEGRPHRTRRRPR